VGKAELYYFRKRIREKNLFRQADDKKRHADGNISPAQPEGLGMQQLRPDFADMQNRPGDQMREKGDERRVAHEVNLFAYPLVAVHQIAHLREREKRNPQRQDHLEIEVPGNQRDVMCE
jgi:hypothetical protein